VRDFGGTIFMVINSEAAGESDAKSACGVWKNIEP